MTNGRNEKPTGMIEMYDIDKDEKPVSNKTWDKWVEDWWTWLIKIPKAQNPANDITGKYASKGDQNGVFFLAGTLKGTAVRTCVIPKGKPVFFPLINDEESFAEKQAYLDFSKSAEKGEFGQKGGEAMRIATSEDVDNMIKLEATFDEGILTLRWPC